VSANPPSPSLQADQNIQTSASVPFAELDHATIAVQVAVQGRPRLMFGTGSYEPDPDLGDVLRIVPYGPTLEPEFMLVERFFTGRIVPGEALHCDYLIRLA
jgi:hypothetical protein